MAKSNKKTGKAKAKAGANKTPVASVDPHSRRTFIRNGLIGGAAFVGVGTWVVSGIRAVAAEQDLSRMGKGVPAVVQIHDPQCAMCTELQREARKALNCFDDEEFVYLVASIRTEEGSAFAAMHGVPHVTLMLFDGAGRVQNVLNGVRQHDELKPVFTRHLRSA